MLSKTIIGRVENVAFPSFGLFNVPAKIDTGADLSSIWATNIVENEAGLQFTLFGKGSPYYTGEVIVFARGDYTITRVSSSFGNKEYRFRVKLPITMAGKRIRATFTLADRKDKLYPILIGRRMISHKFYVDVASGSPLKAEEKQRAQKLKKELKERQDIS
jgi:hypothetical protein